MTIPENSVILHEARRKCWLLFENPCEVVQAFEVSEVLEKLRYVEKRVEMPGLYAVGFVSYDASPAFDPAFVVRHDDAAHQPLLWFGLYAAPSVFAMPAVENSSCVSSSSWHASMSPHDYALAFERIKCYIEEGDAYQVNLTYRLHRSFADDPWPVFVKMASAQRADYGAYIKTPHWTVCCASPELFFRLEGTQLESRPMKGTAPRGLTPEADQANADELQASEKNRAENLMIVDMVRNDMGRIAVPGTVGTPDVLVLEKYPTVWQMTSTVTAETQASVADVFNALFPPASITGAPKARTMQIIAEVETTPRHLYTGAIGFIAPNRHAQFNVAIRTMLVDHDRSEAEYGVGGGIVWDSDCLAEQAECRTKSRILDSGLPVFSLLESLLWTKEGGYALLDQHLRRLVVSAHYFDFSLEKKAIIEKLEVLQATLEPFPHKIRLLVAREGGVTLEAAPITIPSTPARLCVVLARDPIDRGNVFLYFKTTNRHSYNEAVTENPDCDDVILWNVNGEVTESTRANVVAEIDGVLYTPPVSSGLLAGTYRSQMLERGEVTERVITVDELLRSPRVLLVNSVRGIMPVTVSR